MVNTDQLRIIPTEEKLKLATGLAKGRLRLPAVVFWIAIAIIVLMTHSSALRGFLFPLMFSQAGVIGVLPLWEFFCGARICRAPLLVLSGALVPPTVAQCGAALSSVA